MSCSAGEYTRELMESFLLQHKIALPEITVDTVEGVKKAIAYVKEHFPSAEQAIHPFTDNIVMYIGYFSNSIVFYSNTCTLPKYLELSTKAAIEFSKYMGYTL